MKASDRPAAFCEGAAICVCLRVPLGVYPGSLMCAASIAARAHACVSTPLPAVQEIPDSVGLRQRIQQQFELAALPGATEEELEQVLHFVVVGGGPTGESEPSLPPLPHLIIVSPLWQEPWS